MKTYSLASFGKLNLLFLMAGCFLSALPAKADVIQPATPAGAEALQPSGSTQALPSSSAQPQAASSGNAAIAPRSLDSQASQLSELSQAASAQNLTPQRLAPQGSTAIVPSTPVLAQVNPQPVATPSNSQPVTTNLDSFSSNPKSQPPVPDRAAQLSNLALTRSAMEQVTSVSQLSDVQPSDWAFQALQSLVERYGCIVGYPDKTFRGNRALSRYEFAAGLNACMDRVNELIAAGTADLVKKEDLATLQKLQEQFAAELATLRGRVDALEARTAKLEAQQFSTTSKLSGEAIFAVAGAAGGGTGGNDANIVLVDRVRLNINTSFTGKDLLITGLQAYNLNGSVSGAGGFQGTLFPNQSFLTAGTTKFAFEPEFTGFDPKNLSTVGGNSVNLYKLLYVFPAPAIKNLTLFAGTAAEASDAGFGVTPFYNEGQEAVSRFAGLNPVARISGGTSQTGLASAVGFIWGITNNISLRALYGSVNANIPADSGFPATPLGGGFFNGSTVVSAQLDFNLGQAFNLALNYANSHHQLNIMGTGLSNADVGTLFGLPATQDVHVDSYGATVSFKLSPQISLVGYGAIFGVYNDGGPRASTRLTSWMAGVRFADLGFKGSSAGILFGQPLYRVDATGAASLPSGRTTPYHLEGYYRFKVNDHISITPGVFFLFNPEGLKANDTTTVGVLRTTFTF